MHYSSVPASTTGCPAWSRSRVAQPEPPTLHRHHRPRIPLRQRVHVRQHHLPRPVAAELLLVLPAHDRERLQHVARVVAVETVQVEVQRVQPRPQVAALLLFEGDDI